MNKLKNLFRLNEKNIKNKKNFLEDGFDQYSEIGKLVKEARIKQNLTIEELARISKIPEKTIKSLENNNKNQRPKYPFIRSIVIKLEECLALKENTLVTLITKETKTFKNNKKDFIFRKYDLINTWQGTLLYFFILVLTIFVLKRYFISNINIIEIQNTESKRIEKNLLKNS